MDLKEIQGFLANQEFPDDRALQVKSRFAVMNKKLDYLVLRVSQAHQGFQVIQG